MTIMVGHPGHVGDIMIRVTLSVDTTHIVCLLFCVYESVGLWLLFMAMVIIYIRV